MYKSKKQRRPVAYWWHLVLFDVVVNGEDGQISAVGDNSNDLIHLVPRSHTRTKLMMSTVGHQQFLPMDWVFPTVATCPVSSCLLRDSKNVQSCTSRRNNSVLLLNGDTPVLLDVVVNGGDSQTSAVGDDSNDLIHPVPSSRIST